MHEQENDKPNPPPKPNPNGFTDPYEGFHKRDKTRTTIDISSAARADISAVYPKKGVLQTTINILIEKLRNELKRVGLSSYSPEQYEQAIAQCRICLGTYQYYFDKPTGRPRLVLPDPDAGGGVAPRPPARRRKPRGPVEATD